MKVKPVFLSAETKPRWFGGVTTRPHSRKLCFLSSLLTELITAHNRTENVASVIKRSRRASSKPLFQFNTTPQKGRSGLRCSPTLFVKYKYTVVRSNAHDQRRLERERAERVQRDGRHQIEGGFINHRGDQGVLL